MKCLMSKKPPEKELNLLLVEDDDDDARMFQIVLEAESICNRIVRARHGQEALEILHQPPDRAITKFDIIVTDINMPVMDGIEFLKSLRADPVLRKSIVFILTTSTDQRDIQLAYDYNVTGYISKTRIGYDFLELIELLRSYYKLIELPPYRTQS